MKFDVLTIFPGFFNSFLEESLIKKALDEELIGIGIHDLRDYTQDKHKTVDDRPFGGGYGMVYKVEPVYKAVNDLKEENSRVIVFSPRGEQLTQKKVTQLSKYDQLIMICGRYEGVDQRVEDHIADEVISVGDYVLLGGEVPAMSIIESVSRLVPNVIGDKGILEERVTDEGGFYEYEQYTQPRVFTTDEGEEWEVPEVLLSGDHKKIEEWRKEHSKDVGEE